MAETILNTVHVFICFALIGIVLLQQGKGADVGAAFGGGGNTFFGASGADNLLTRVTTVIAGCFMVTSVLLALHMRDGHVDNSSLMQSLPSSNSEGSNTVESTPVEAPVAAKTAPATTEGPVTAAPVTAETTSTPTPTPTQPEATPETK